MIELIVVMIDLTALAFYLHFKIKQMSKWHRNKVTPRKKKDLSLAMLEAHFKEKRVQSDGHKKPVCS